MGTFGRRSSLQGILFASTGNTTENRKLGFYTFLVTEKRARVSPPGLTLLTSPTEATPRCHNLMNFFSAPLRVYLWSSVLRAFAEVARHVNTAATECQGILERIHVPSTLPKGFFVEC